MEEQYYLVFPLFLLVAWRFGRQPVFYMILGFTALSLLISEWGWRNEPVANFYLSPPRAWELLAGSICAFILSARDCPTGPASLRDELLAALGLAAILISIFIYDNQTPFPSLYTVLPVGGAVLIILYASPATKTGQLLAMKPFVGIGLISYSAYLWHQPLFAFARIRSIQHPDQILMLGLAGLSLILAYLSWRFIEQPFRHKDAGPLPTRRAVFAAALAGSLVFIGLGALGQYKDGNLWRLTGDRLAHYQQTREAAFPKVGCARLLHDTTVDACVLGDSNSTTRVLAMGDSHIDQWSETLDALGRKNGWKVEIYTKGACPVAALDFFYPLLDRFYHECSPWRAAVLERIVADPPDLVLATQSSASYIGLKGGLAGQAFTARDIVSYTDFSTGLGRSLDAFSKAGMPVLWLIDNPRYDGFHPLECHLKNEVLNYSPNIRCETTRDRVIDTRLQQIEMEAVARSATGRAIDFTSQYCDGEVCPTVIANRPVMRDSNHISASMASQLGAELELYLKEALVDR